MEQFKVNKYVAEKMASFKKGQFVNTQKRGVGVVDEVTFERISDGWSFGLQSEYGWKCTAICHVANETEKVAYARQQAEKAEAEKKQAERKDARERLNTLAGQSKEQGTEVEHENIQGSTTRVNVQQDSYNNFYFLIGDAAIWYVEMRDVYSSIWRLDTAIAEELQKLNSILA